MEEELNNLKVKPDINPISKEIMIEKSHSNTYNPENNYKKYNTCKNDVFNGLYEDFIKRSLQK